MRNMRRYHAYRVALLLGLAIACVSEQRIDSEFAAANYCDINEDRITVSCTIHEPNYDTL